MIVIFDIVILILCCISLVMHLFGVYLMTHMYNKGRKTGQKLYLISFSLFEVAKALVEIGLLSIAMLSSQRPSSTIVRLQHHLAIISETMMTFVYYALMFYITIERFIAVTLGMRYCIYGALNRSKITLIITWITGSAIGFTFCLLYESTSFYYVPYNHYVYLFMDIAFTTIAVITYGTLFSQHTKSINFRVNPNGSRRRSTIVEIYNGSKFYIPILLMSSFLFFMVIPDSMYVLLVCLASHQDSASLSRITRLSPTKNIVWHCMTILNVTSDIINACIYIFVEKRTRKNIGRIVSSVKIRFSQNNKSIRNKEENACNMMETGF